MQEICDKEGIKAEKTALHVIAQKSEGCMRDSLSILDKIVSFTNGAVTYQNTLEHLNILDEAYYFKLLDYLQSQDLSSALLMYDEINSKGFEGDTVLNGLAEFLRNLLVSKDARVAMLLEVAEDFKPLYVQTAQKTNVAYIISALNVLNEAEINFKQARNKRLHVELSIIKLCYLQQALELTGNEGILNKKKLIDSVKTIAFKALPIKRVTSTEAKTFNAGRQVANYTDKYQSTKNLQLSEAKLMIEEPVVNIVQSNPQPVTVSNQSSANSSSSLGSLKNIRQKIANQNKAGEEPAKPLTEEELHAAWGLFVQQLREKSKHSAVTNFRAALLKVLDANTVEITTLGEIHKGFIELERPALIEHLQTYFSNRLLTYQVLVQESTTEEEPTEKPLTRKQQYFKMIEEYPMVKELKDRLKLDLE